MKEVFETIKTRINSPLFGYIIIAFLTINWKVIAYLVAGEVAILERIEYFERNTTIDTLLIFPLLFALICPWINWMYLLASKKPTEWINNIQIDHDIKIQNKIKELEQITSSREEELLSQIDRDKEIDKIEDPDKKAEVISEIEKLRTERDKLKLDLYTESGKKIINDRDKFLNVYRQLEVIRNLVKNDPDNYERRYANLLSDYISHLINMGEQDNVKTYINEELNLREQMAKKNPALYEQSYNDSLKKYKQWVTH